MTSVVIRVDEHVKKQLDEHRWKTEKNYNAAILRLVAIYEAATFRVAVTPKTAPHKPVVVNDVDVSDRVWEFNAS